MPGPIRRALRHPRRAATLSLIALGIAATAGPGAASAADPGWTDRALALQERLAGDVPLRDVPWVSTHNSYNSTAEMGTTLSALDPNQRLTVVEQLDAGVRHLEIDAHPALAPLPELGLPAPQSCHTICTLERPLADVLARVATWSRSRPDSVLLLYVETHLDSAAGPRGYDTAAGIVAATLGDLVYRPPSAGARCDPLPRELSRDRILESGRRVVIFGPCGQGKAWPSWSFDEADRLTAPDNAAFRPAADCGPDFSRGQYDAFPVRYYEDRTAVGALTGTGHTPIGPDLVRAMQRCGVDIIGFDHLLRDDPRRGALVWSWAPGEPRPDHGSCAVQRADGRWAVRDCGVRRRVACRTADGAWTVPVGRLPRAVAQRACPPGATHAVPRTAREGGLLQDAMAAAGVDEAWVAHARRGTGWVRDERAGCTVGLLRPTGPLRVRHGRVRLRPMVGYPCTGESLRRRVMVTGGRRPLRVGTARGGRSVTVAVGPRVRRLRMSFVVDGRRRTATVALRR
ncbi:MAG: hypothetical protein AB7G37_04070 [Solirubrobacteraceae bacterium]